jgi:protein TilB
VPGKLHLSVVAAAAAAAAAVAVAVHVHVLDEPEQCVHLQRAEHNEYMLSTLEEVALHQQNIESIELIGQLCPKLRILYLQNNLIGKIQNLHKLKVSVIDTPHILLIIPCLCVHGLKVLNPSSMLAFCQDSSSCLPFGKTAAAARRHADSCQLCGSLQDLEYLNLAINNITKVQNLQRCESLQRLDLTINFIPKAGLFSICSLAANYNLQDLFLTGNPCTDWPGYRQYLVAKLPQLDTLVSEHVWDSSL